MTTPSASATQLPQQPAHRTASAATPSPYELILFVTGASELAMRAIENVRSICELHLAGRYRLEVVDIHQSASLTVAHNILAAPTLIRTSPQPIRRLVGDMSNTSRVLSGLGIRAEPVPLK